jgi:hypothetical protein
MKRFSDYVIDLQNIHQPVVSHINVLVIMFSIYTTPLSQ